MSVHGFKILEGYKQQGLWKELLERFWKMEDAGVTPNRHVYMIVLQACGHLPRVEDCREIHACIIKYGHKIDMAITACLITNYAKNRALEDASELFSQSPLRSATMWNAIVIGYARHGPTQEAIQLFWKMQDDDFVTPNEHVSVSILKACAKVGNLKEGKRVHDVIVRNSLEASLSTGNTLIDMYSKCGSIVDARQVFDKILQPDVITWSAMIAGYGEHKLVDESFKLFMSMEMKCLYLNDVTYLNLLKACRGSEYLEKAREIHDHIIKLGLTLSGFLENALIDAYAKCGSLADASHVFKLISIHNVVSWTALITGHTQHGLHKDAITLFQLMRTAGINPTSTTFVSILKASAASESLTVGQCLHHEIYENGQDLELLVGSAIIDMYSKCGSVRDALHVLNKMPKRNIISWSSLLACSAERQSVEETINLFRLMQADKVKPDEITFVSILKACLKWGMLEQGRCIHKHALKTGHKLSFFLGSTLIDMYTRCGSLDDAHQVFDEIKCRDVALWNTMIIAYGQHGLAVDAFQTLRQMQQDGMKANHVTFIGLLSACSHSGLLNEGHHLFESIMVYDCSSVTLEHYVCIIDMFGRSGSLEESVESVHKMLWQPDVTVWASVFGACKMSCNLKLASTVIPHIFELDPYNKGAFIFRSSSL